MKLIVKGDDLGWTDGVNAGIEKAARDGILTAAGCMPNMPAAQQGLRRLLAYPQVSIGAHVNVVSGNPVSESASIPHLVDEQGCFHSSRYYRELEKKRIDPLPWYEEAVREIRAQVEQFRAYAGRLPEYLEGHAIPSRTFDKALRDVAEQYGIVHLEFTALWDRRYNLYRGPLGKYAMDIFRTSDPYAQFQADAEVYFLEDEGKVLDKERAMLVFHPGFVDAELMRVSSFHGVRIRDCAALCSPRVRQWLIDHDVELINFSELRKQEVTV